MFLSTIVGDAFIYLLEKGFVGIFSVDLRRGGPITMKMNVIFIDMLKGRSTELKEELNAWRWFQDKGKLVR